MDVHSIFETDSDLQQWSEDIILDCYNGQSVAANSIILGISTGSPALREMLSIAVSSSEAKLPMYGDRMEQWKLALRFLYPLERRTAVTWDNIEQLLVLGDKYDLRPLLGCCEDFLLNNEPRCYTEFIRWIDLSDRYGLHQAHDMLSEELEQREAAVGIELSCAEVDYFAESWSYSHRDLAPVPTQFKGVVSYSSRWMPLLAWLALTEEAAAAAAAVLREAAAEAVKELAAAALGMALAPAGQWLRRMSLPSTSLPWQGAALLGSSSSSALVA